MDHESSTIWYQANLDVFLNRWFSNYDEALNSLQKDGGYLLPYRQHFLVCEAEAITAMGLDPKDADWEAIDRDCARPANNEAYQRLLEKRRHVIKPKSD